jgi:hypothetical protein
MFLIHKHSLLQKFTIKGGVEEILASEVCEGDILRGYDLFTQSWTRVKVLSRINIMARKIAVKTSLLEPTYISEDTYIASTSGIWGHRSSIFNVKLFKKNSTGNIFQTPRPVSTKFEELDLFVSIATGNSADTMLVDNYIYVTKDWNGLKIKSMGGTGTAQSVDAGQGKESGTGSGESGT